MALEEIEAELEGEENEILGYLGTTAFRSHQVQQTYKGRVQAIHLYFLYNILISQIQSL